eukprot:77760-Amphidinium_carterae.2
MSNKLAIMCSKGVLKTAPWSSYSLLEVVVSLHRLRVKSWTVCLAIYVSLMIYSYKNDDDDDGYQSPGPCLYNSRSTKCTTNKFTIIEMSKVSEYVEFCAQPH